MKAFLILLAVFGFSMPACAFDCFELDTRESVQICLKHELESEDQTLNQHYSEASELVSGDDKLRLRKEQIDWIIKRNNYCQIDSSLSNDPQWIEKLSSQFAKAICTSNLTKLRSTELSKQANNHRLRLHKELESFPRVENPWQAAYLAGKDIPIGKFRAFYFSTGQPDTVVWSELTDEISLERSDREMHGIIPNTLRVYWVGHIDFVSEQTMALVINPLSWGESKVLVDKRQVFAGKQVSYIPLKFSAGRHLIEVEFNNHWHSAHFRASLIPGRYVYTASQIATELSRELFDDVEILFAGAYRSGNDDFSIDIDLMPLTKPTVLFLSSYEVVKWRLKDIPVDKNVKAVILSGYEIGSDIVMPEGMKAVIYTLGARYFGYEFQPKCECARITWRCESKGPSEVVSSLEKITGKKVVGLSGAHNPRSLVVPWVTFDSVSGYVEYLKDDELELQRQQCFGMRRGVVGRD